MIKSLRATVFAATASVALLSASLANAAIYVVNLSGSAESPPNASAGTGTATVITDPAAHTLFITLTFSGLTGTTTASHIHAATAVPLTGTAGVATQVPTFSAFPLGVTSGSFSQTLNTLDLASYNPAYVTANGGTAASAEAALFAAIGSGRSYLNIHTSFVPGGEIRGFLVAAPVPELASWAMMLIGFAGIGAAMRRRPRASASV